MAYAQLTLEKKLFEIHLKQENSLNRIARE
ncbi:hypothetical protein SAMN05421863_102431 [Nitrosomonas communis]|uniref:Uncharacterized protein n=1 Tax=Nitrosomonas communis TaxID=44574 RepID=A0A1I4Q1H7_9PROT|nr:hypothetical protein SAMN05421863_102431 [Nitrosomonas communis]